MALNLANLLVPLQVMRFTKILNLCHRSSLPQLYTHLVETCNQLVPVHDKRTALYDSKLDFGLTDVCRVKPLYESQILAYARPLSNLLKA